MKKILFLLLTSVAANAQTIDFPDPAFKAKLLQSQGTNSIALSINNVFISIDDDGDGEIQISEALQVKRLNVAASNINSLNGLEYFINIETLSCQSNNLTALDLSALSNLMYLDCYTNQITYPSLHLPASILMLNCSNNLLTNINLSETPILSDLTCASNQISALDFSVLPNLNSVVCSNNSLTSLDFSHNPVFEDLWCDSNNLTFLNIKNGYPSANLEANWGDNPNLTYICADEEDDVVNYMLQVYFSSQIITVNTYCSFVPGGDFNTITGMVTIDADADGCESTDSRASFVKMNILEAAITNASFTDVDGNYNFYVNSGSFTVTPSLENPDWFTVSPTNTNINFLGNGETFTQNFCLSPNGVHSDVEIAIVPVWRFSPGFETLFKIVYRNKGNQILNGNLSFEFDDAKLEFISSTPVPDILTSGLLIFNYSNLDPFEVRYALVKLKVNGPTDTPAVNIGDSFGFNSNINPIPGDEMPSDNSFVINRITTGPYDPNVKTCLEGDVVAPSSIGKYIHYNINFENIGDETATNVVVKDTIDITKFDINTLQVLESSHNVDVRIRQNVVEFFFENINLPSAMANPIGGHGNVLFKIKTLPTLYEGDVVTNTANIYFDYNHPVETNEARTTFSTLKRQEFVTDNSVVVYPNPAKNNIAVQAKNNIQSIALFDIQGRVLQVIPANSNKAIVDISDQTNGIYFIKVTTTDGVKVEKMIKE